MARVGSHPRRAHTFAYYIEQLLWWAIRLLWTLIRPSLERLLYAWGTRLLPAPQAR